MDILGFFFASQLVVPPASYLLGRWRTSAGIRIPLWLGLCWWWIPVWAIVSWSGLRQYWEVAVVLAVGIPAVNSLPLIMGRVSGEQAERDHLRLGRSHSRHTAPPSPPA